MDFKVGERLVVQGQVCTVRFVGEIANWPGETTLGLEWDSAERGKNNGSLDGIKYFETRGGAKSGSFMKLSSQKLANCKGTSFIGALCDKYGRGMSLYLRYNDLFDYDHSELALTQDRDTKVLEIKIGSKIVESYGFESLDRLQSQFQRLQIVSLDSCGIGSNKNEFPDHKLELHKVLPSLRILDVSCNLLTRWDDVLSILQFSAVEDVNLNGNHLSSLCELDASTESTKSLELSQIKLPSVTRLKLAATFTKDFAFILKSFPNLVELNLSGNSYTDKDDLSALCGLKHLKILDISYNSFTEIPYQYISQMALEKLIISNNVIRCLEVTQVSSLQELDIRTNLISDWKEVDTLNLSFLNLVKLRINDNNVISDEESDLQVIARFDSNLLTLNGTNISLEERKNYELYFLSLIRKDRSQFTQFLLTKRYRTLCQDYGIDESQNTEEIAGKLSSNIVRFEINYKDSVSPLTTFKYYTIGNLKGKISELVNRSALEFTISYNITQGVKEYLKDDLSMIRSTGLTNHDTIYVELQQS